MKVKFTTPSFIPASEREKFSQKVERVLTQVSELSCIEDWASESVYDYVGDMCGVRRLRDVALMIFNTDWPPSELKLREIRIEVEGYCPECGTELEEKSYETEKATYDYPGSWINYLECPKCTYNNLKL